ncbi:MAG: S-layer homology domain-containing protein [Chloroflexota bacterium]|nr:S-layer homology domain-containing protein [Chloroflexota bacterium]
MTHRKRSLQIVVMLALLGLALGVAGSNTLAALPSPAAALAALPATGHGQTANAVAGNVVVGHDITHDESIPLRDIPPIKPQPGGHIGDADHLQVPSVAAHGKDPVIQNWRTHPGAPAIPSPLQSFDGLYNYWGIYPPDTNGDVGPNHYVQIANLGFQIYNKTGTSLYGPANVNTLFTGLGGPCEARNDGDPIALYDSQADRWLLTQFTSAAPYYQCLAVSTSPDPTGSYYRYAFQISATALNDYPHFGVWPDGYYVSFNMFQNGASFIGAEPAVFDRTRMLAGQAATFQAFSPDPSNASFLPADLDGVTPPPTGAPNTYTEIDSSPTQLRLFNFHVDWVTPTNSTFLQSGTLPVAAFSSPVGITQPNTTQTLATLGGRLMYRAAYRNFGTYQAIVTNHTVLGTGGVDGVRWYELRSPAATPTLFQQGTYSPADGLHRWMGSIAQDHMGNMAVGYSGSNSSTFPSILYTGRLVTDTLGTLPQGEGTFMTGTGSQTGTAGRWGDYSMMAVDPSDDCTFWYTTEYLSQTGERDWRTRIGSFKFANCVPLPPTLTATPTPLGSATATRTPSPIATATQCAGAINVTGTITNTDPTEAGRLVRDGVRSTCAAPKAPPAANDTLPRHYKVYTYTNNTGGSQCVTVNITNNCGNNALLSTAYSPAFVPSAITTNYLADMGVAGPTFSYSFTLAAATSADVVVEEADADIGCSQFQLSINACGITGTATNTPTITVTPSPTASPTVVCQGVTYLTTTTAAATLVPATNDTGNHCDDCTTGVTFPFPVTFYGTPYPSANVSSNGNLQFTSTNGSVYGPPAPCLPITPNNAGVFGPTIFPYFDDFLTDAMTMTHGIFTATTGTAPNRQFVVRWQTTYFNHTGDANFEILFNESSPTISILYGADDNNGAEASSGVQLNPGQYTAYSCNMPVLTNGTRVDYVPVSCNGTSTPTAVPPSATATVTSTATNTSVPSATNTSVPSATNTSVPSVTVTAVPSDTPCTIHFTDVTDPTAYYYQGVYYLACHGVISGYSDGTYKPFNNTTRGQMTKIVTLAFNIPLVTPPALDNRTFTDVTPDNVFYQLIETAAARQIVSGYTCGGINPQTGAAEPCDSARRPYFRPSSFVTRGQLTKIVVIGAAFPLLNPVRPTFTDVTTDNVFYKFIETAVCHGIITGYSDQTFRPNNYAFRGQIAKIVYLAVTNPQATCPVGTPAVR